MQSILLTVVLTKKDLGSQQRLHVPSPLIEQVFKYWFFLAVQLVLTAPIPQFLIQYKGALGMVKLLMACPELAIISQFQSYQGVQFERLKMAIKDKQRQIWESADIFELIIELRKLYRINISISLKNPDKVIQNNSEINHLHFLHICIPSSLYYKEPSFPIFSIVITINQLNSCVHDVKYSYFSYFLNLLLSRFARQTDSLYDKQPLQSQLACSEGLNHNFTSFQSIISIYLFQLFTRQPNSNIKSYHCRQNRYDCISNFRNYRQRKTGPPKKKNMQVTPKTSIKQAIINNSRIKGNQISSKDQRAVTAKGKKILIPPYSLIKNMGDLHPKLTANTAGRLIVDWPRLPYSKTCTFLAEKIWRTHFQN